MPLFLKLGLQREYLEPLAGKLPALCRVLFEPCPNCDFGSMARHLKVRVRENGRTKVALTQCASSIDNLGDPLDEDAKRRIGLQQIVFDVRSRGYLPAPVFNLADGEKHIEVWLQEQFSQPSPIFGSMYCMILVRSSLHAGTVLESSVEVPRSTPFGVHVLFGSADS